MPDLDDSKDASEFWQKMQNATSAEEIESIVRDYTVDLIEVKEQHYANDGEFLPLAVWQHRGFDSDRILQNHKPSDHRVCSVLGDVYRCAIMVTGDRGSKGVRKSEGLAGKKKIKDDEQNDVKAKRLQDELNVIKKKQRLDAAAVTQWEKTFPKVRDDLAALKQKVQADASKFPDNVHTSVGDLAKRFDTLSSSGSRNLQDSTD